MRHSIIILGGTQTAIRCARTAVRLGARTTLVTPCVPDDVPAPSFSSLREAVLTLTGFRHRHVSPELFERRGQLSMNRVRQLAQEIERSVSDSSWSGLRELGIDHVVGPASLGSPNEIFVRATADQVLRLRADRVVLATDSAPSRPAWIPFDGETVIDIDETLRLQRVPRSMVIVASSTAGLELAFLFAILGTKVSVVSDSSDLLSFADASLQTELWQRGAALGITPYFDRFVKAIESPGAHPVRVVLDDGDVLSPECVVYAGERCGNTRDLNLETLGLETDERGRFWCNEFGQTWVRQVYAVGDLVGHPRYAALMRDQESRVVHHALGKLESPREPVVRCLNAVPQLAAVGATEADLRHTGMDYVVGQSRFLDSSRGFVGGDEQGVLKLLFGRESGELLGAQSLGESANHLMRIAQTMIATHRTLAGLSDDLFGATELTECFQRAVTAALSRLRDPRPAIERPVEPSTTRGSAVSRVRPRAAVRF
jgi:NAD(P) transhydrogenase